MCESLNKYKRGGLFISEDTAEVVRSIRRDGEAGSRRSGTSAGLAGEGASCRAREKGLACAKASAIIREQEAAASILFGGEEIEIL